MKTLLKASAGVVALSAVLAGSSRYQEFGEGYKTQKAEPSLAQTRH